MTLTALRLVLGETTKGVSIDDCAQESVHVANALKIMVEFEFNDLKIVVCPNETMQAVVGRYYREHEARRNEA